METSIELARDLAVILLVPLAGLAAVDGVYLHLWRFRLHERPECRREHRLHTARALLFPLGLVLVYGHAAAGAWIYAGAAIVLADTGLELWDCFEEPASRRLLGGLSQHEALLHVVLVTLRAASLALAFVSKPAAAWAWDAHAVLAPAEPWHAAVALQLLLPGAVAVAALHVALALSPGCCTRVRRTA